MGRGRAVGGLRNAGKSGGSGVGGAVGRGTDHAMTGVSPHKRGGKHKRACSRRSGVLERRTLVVFGATQMWTGSDVSRTTCSKMSISRNVPVL